MPKAEYTLERIADRMEIHDQLLRYSRGVDRKDWDLLRSVYHDDAYDNHGIFVGSGADFVEFTRKRHATVLMSMHHLPNILIEFIAPDTALVETYILAWQSLSAQNNDMRAAVSPQGDTSDQPIEMIMVSRYIDHFERKNDRWAIQERNLVYESAMKVTPDATGPDVSGMMEMGRRDDQDMLSRLRRQLIDRRETNAALLDGGPIHSGSPNSLID